MIEQVPQEQVVSEEDDKEKMERTEILRKLRKKIRPYFIMLDKIPSSDLEKVLASGDQEHFPEWMFSNTEAIHEAEVKLIHPTGMGRRRLYNKYC